MPTFVHGKTGIVLIGAYDLTAYFQETNIQHNKELADVTAYKATPDGHAFLPGLLGGSVELSGMFDGSTDVVDARLDAAMRATTVTTATIGVGENTTVGNRARLFQFWDTDYRVSSPITDKSVVAATLQAADQFGIQRGHWHANLAVQTGLINYTSVDGLSSSTNGGIASVHITAFTGTDCVIKIQHSTTSGGVYADLTPSGTYTGITSDVLVIAAGTTINQFTRAAITGGTFTSITLAVAFARR